MFCVQVGGKLSGNQKDKDHAGLGWRVLSPSVDVSAAAIKRVLFGKKECDGGPFAAWDKKGSSSFLKNKYI